MKSPLIDLNGFTLTASGVHHLPDADGNTFDYSDGDAAEQRLHEILSSASDLSSNSNELQSRIVDWPTEYHLSATRANLLRALDLTGVRRVLELGCGCGAITRYLAEQPEIAVDAIEGSRVRAELAALRCAGMQNVNLFVANFNDMQLPDNHYDLVVFVGVTEYAGRFADGLTDQAALDALLQTAKRVSADTGVTLIAIENRVGLKYLLGANEDHYAAPYIGIDEYPDRDGIRTYSKPEWNARIQASGYQQSEFLYPFPDYKVPTVVLSDPTLNSVDADVLSDISSRDYGSGFSMGEQEASLWTALLNAGTLGDHANSFMILLSEQKQTLRTMVKPSVARFPQPELAYLKQPATSPAGDQQNPRRMPTSDEVAQLRSEIAHLRNHISLIEGSLSWRLTSRLRRLLGRDRAGRQDG